MFPLFLGTVDKTNETVKELVGGHIPISTADPRYPVRGMAGGTPTEYMRRLTATGGATATLTLTVPSGGLVEIDDMHVVATTLTAGETIALDILDSGGNVRRKVFAAQAISASGKWISCIHPLSRAALAEDNYVGIDPSELPYKLYEAQAIKFTTSSLTAADKIDFTISYRSVDSGVFVEAVTGGAMSAIP